ncbi:MAG: sugar transferase [Gammaproteobacteria bacterium]|nr:sugar transferase [Gammaproteobacteria bacterium]
MVNSSNSLKGWKVYDAVCMALCFIAVSMFILKPGYMSFSGFLLIRVSVGNIFMFASLVLLWHLTFSMMRVYGQTYWSNACKYSSSEVTNVVKASIVGSLVIVALASLSNINFYNVTFFLMFMVSTAFTVLLGRYIHRDLCQYFLYKEDNLRKLLIVGVNSRSIRMAKQIKADHKFGYQILGFVDQSTRDISDFDETGLKLVTDIEGLPDYLRSTALDEVVVCLPFRSQYDDILHISSICEKQGIAVGMLPDLLPFNPLLSGMQQFGDQAVMTLNPHRIKGIEAIIKRLFDIVVSASLLIFLMPVFLLIMAVIKSTSPGPSFFMQERLGLNKQRFRMVKFRSMKLGAEERMAEIEELNEAEGPVFKIKNDPRITKVGKFLRKSSLDELPQLINVLRGEMSLVGPRPLTVRDYEGFSEDWHRRRFSIRPGITGLWQVSGRCDLPFEQWMQLDMQYIDQWSLALDMKVLLKTLPAVISGSGAE